MNDDDGDEYTLHHEYPKSSTEVDEKCISAVINYISEKRNPFGIDNSNPAATIVTMSKVNIKSSTFVLQCSE